MSFLFPKLSQSLKKSEEREFLRKRSFTEFISKNDSISKNPLVLHEVLEDEGYLLPSKKTFSMEWANLFIKGEKEFLKKLEIPNFEENFQKKKINLEKVRNAMNGVKVKRFFYVDDKKIPNLGYFIKVMKTMESDWFERNGNEFIVDECY